LTVMPSPTSANKRRFQAAIVGEEAAPAEDYCDGGDVPLDSGQGDDDLLSPLDDEGEGSEAFTLPPCEEEAILGVRGAPGGSHQERQENEKCAIS